jgi:hypothetical protein
MMVLAERRGVVSRLVHTLVDFRFTFFACYFANSLVDCLVDSTCTLDFARDLAQSHRE